MSEVFKTVLSMSIGASVLAVLVLIARAIIGRRQTLVLTILFAMLVAKLIVPLSMQSNASIFNILPTPFAQTAQVEEFVPSIADETAALPQEREADGAQALLQPENISAELTESAAVASETELMPEAVNDTMPESAATRREPLMPIEIAAIVWLCGMAAMAAIIAVSNIAFMRKVRKNRAYDAPGFNDMLRKCAQEFGIRQKIKAVRMSDVNTVAVCGIFRPKLLIAPDTFEELSRAEQRHVIMHELSHIKRRDTLVCLIITMVNVLHWFNPFVWVAFAIFRKDLEVMCDAKVLRKMETGERHGYANTLVTLAKKAGTRNTHLAMALFMSKASIKRRIAMIAKYKANKPLVVALALVLAVGVAITGCTTGVNDITQIGERGAVEIGELELIASYTMEISGYADDAARIHNIKKAASILNGVRIMPDEQISFIDTIGPITAEEGWQNAPAFTLESVRQMAAASHWDSALVIQTDPQIEQIGGGIGLIEAAFFVLGGDAHLDRGAGGNFEGLIFADTDLLNWFDTDVVFETIEDGNTITVNLYGKVYTAEQMERMRVEKGEKEEKEANEETITSTVTAYKLGTCSIDFSFCADDKNIISNIVKTMGILEGKVFNTGQQEILMANEIYDEDGWEIAPARSWTDIGELKSDNIRHIEYLDTELQRGGGSEIVLAAVKGAAIEAGLSVTSLDPGEAVLNEKMADVMLSIILRGNSIYALFYAHEPIETLAPTETPFEDEEPEFVPQIIYNGDIGPEHLSVDEAKSLVIEYCELLYDITLEKPLISAIFDLPNRDHERATWAIFSEKICFRIDAITGSIIFYFNSSFNVYVEKDPMPLERSILADENYFTKAEDVVVRILGNSGKIEDTFIDGIQDVYNGNEPVSYSVDVWVVMETGPCYIISFVGDAKRVSRIASFATKQDLFAGNDIG